MIFHEEGFVTWLDRPQAIRLPISSDYVERFWLPIVGPASIAVLRWADRVRPGVFPVARLGAQIGLTSSATKNSPVWRTLNRMVQFHLAEQINDQAIVIWSRVPALTKRQLSTLDEEIRADEERWWMAAATNGPIRHTAPLIG